MIVKGPSGGAVAMLAALMACTPGSEKATPEPGATVVIPQDRFARVNGVTLHYLDWGGTGDLLLFLPGLSHTAHTFDQIAPAFTDQYHAMGLTRRAHGASERAATGYDLDTLATDIGAFINAVGASRVILIGHSFAGLEMPLVAARQPDRIKGLVFLDAVYDWAFLRDSARLTPLAPRMFAAPDSAMASTQALEDWNRRRFPSDWGPAMVATLRSQTYLEQDGRVAWRLTPELQGRFMGLGRNGADYSGIRAPTLAVWANQAEPAAANMKSYGFAESDIESVKAWVRAVDVPAKRRGIAALENAVPGATIVEMEAPHTLLWAKPAEVVRLIKGFLERR